MYIAKNSGPPIATLVTATPATLPPRYLIVPANRPQQRRAR
ncbi:hypothetical protein HX92_2250 [Mycobacterium tuberculosis]|nr:hypothetical protein BCGT_3015 [Mycobacterium tuberculosis variant bovis BCG str. ATCC 35743]AOZ44489.1 hypothetical protein BTB1458_3493 [Mycobacterium tuberculosis]EQM16541.1 hypothetical protein FJ05194_4149 [Mycobacterium tuberculosis FJ05194]KQL75188.1 hypothetical protein HX92_2250 [Mycobacterium tuberculosis]GAA46797.1 hypothetical protein NCGM2209_3441 [Mycobacterium tuberculosis NCGM2209]